MMGANLEGGRGGGKKAQFSPETFGPQNSPSYITTFIE